MYIKIFLNIMYYEHKSWPNFFNWVFFDICVTKINRGFQLAQFEIYRTPWEYILYFHMRKFCVSIKKICFNQWGEKREPNSTTHKKSSFR